MTSPTLHTRGRTSTRAGHRARAAWGAALVLPALALFCAFAIWPALRVFYLSLFDYDLTSAARFVGTDNFQFLVADARFGAVLIQSAFYVAFTYIPAILLALALALALRQRRPGARWVRMAYFLPVAMSWVAVAVIWRLVFHGEGLVNATFGLDVAWLTSNTWARWTLVVMGIWKETGFFLIILLAGLRSIPTEVVESAWLDGANAWRRLRHVIVPMLMPILAVCVVMATIRGFQSFSSQIVMTEGSFGTEVLNLFIYKTAFANARMGRASAVAVLMFFGLFAITIAQLFVFRKRD